MRLFEYQSKSFLKKAGLPVPESRLVTSMENAESAMIAVGFPCVVKAQILAGGRGKAGGIVLSKDAPTARGAIQNLLGQTLVTVQNAPEGEVVRSLLIEQARVTIQQELYAALLIDRKKARVSFLGAKAGGMDIEALAKESPESLLQFDLPLEGALPAYTARRIASAYGFSGALFLEAAVFFKKMTALFFATDATLLEINPLAVTSEGHLVCLDAKMTIDDNALFRQPDFLSLRETMPMPEEEKAAAQAQISYIKLDGNIGCLVNGAGLAMGTMDLIKHHGGAPANFLDVGGGANQAQVEAAIGIILKDPHVKAILVNIFGGIMRCDVIANAIVSAAANIKIKVPLVVRLEGNNAAEGRQILKEAGLSITPANSLEEAANTAVRLGGGAR